MPWIAAGRHFGEGTVGALDLLHGVVQESCAHSVSLCSRIDRDQVNLTCALGGSHTTQTKSAIAASFSATEVRTSGLVQASRTATVCEATQSG